MPFEPKRNMRLAPKSRVDISTLTDRLADLDSLMASQVVMFFSLSSSGLGVFCSNCATRHSRAFLMVGPSVLNELPLVL